MQANTICKSQKRFMLSLKLDQISGSIPDAVGRAVWLVNIFKGLESKHRAY